MEEIQGDESPEEALLLCARQGLTNVVHDLLTNRQQGRIHLDLNCKGKLKSNRGWSPLHLAAYFGHADVVKQLLEAGANVNVVNNVGDTPLHRAAFTGRVDVVTLLLTYQADVSLTNAEGETPKSVAKMQHVIELLEAAEKHEVCRLEEELMSSVREGNIGHIDKMLTSGRFDNLSVMDEYGNTPLHLAAQAEQRQVAVYLLQHGVSTDVKNKQGMKAVDVARTPQMKQLLGVKPKVEAVSIPQRYEGILLKKSTLFGKTALWAVVERGVLSYFKNRGDASTGVKRRGMKYLDEARVLASTENNFDFCVDFSDGAEHRLGTDPASGEPVLRQRWINALKDHIAYNTHYIHKGGVVAGKEAAAPVETMQDAFQLAQAHQKLLESKVRHLANYIQGSSNTKLKPENFEKLEKDLRIVLRYSTDMSSSLAKCLTLFNQQEEIHKKQLHEETEKARVLQEALHALALEHHELEKSYSRSSIARSYVTDDDEFYDCDDDSMTGFRRPMSPGARSTTSVDAISYKSCMFDFNDGDGFLDDDEDRLYYHIDLRGRSKLPVPMFDRNDFSFWSILKQCIGKELSKITMPVVFNEPLTFLQRITEYLEYGSLIETASQQDNPVDRLMYVTAFAVSSISSNWERIGKPFNPLLGETFELDRPDLGFRLISEQVSHHPPISAFHVEAKHFKFHGSIHPKLKFWGKSVEINPKGIVTLELLKHGEVYTWQNVNCCVHNVIVGKLWVEHFGVMEVLNHKTRHKAVLNFKQGGWFGKDLHKCEGFIYDPDKRKVKALYGSWVYDLFGIDVQKYDEHLKGKTDNSPKHTTTENGEKKSEVEDNIPTHHFSTFNLNIPDQVCLWRATPRPPNSDMYFSFTQFALALNEITDGMLEKLPPTDSRLRPDVRRLEEGNIDVAAEEKNRLEEKQRAARKERKKSKAEWTPLWFKYGVNPTTDKEDWLFTDKYWQKDWSAVPDVF